MDPLERLAAYEKMRADIQAEYHRACETMAQLKVEGKEKTVRFRTAFTAKLTCQDILGRYENYGL